MQVVPNPILIGMAGSGKSTIGKPLATRLQYRFHDSDDDIRENTGLDVANWLESFGDEKFLSFEAAKIVELYHDLTKTVLSTGGSVVLVPKSVEFLKQRGKLILLDTPIEEILRRSEHMRIDRIVGMNGESPRFKTLKELFEYRREIYSQVRAITVNTFGKETNEIVDEIVRALS